MGVAEAYQVTPSEMNPESETTRPEPLKAKVTNRIDPVFS
jgi:hypothetical protein